MNNARNGTPRVDQVGGRYFYSAERAVVWPAALAPVSTLFRGLAMPDFSSLTERQREIYDFIREKIESRGYGPTVREIGEGFDIKSPNGVMCHLKALEKKGLIVRKGFSARAIQLVDYHPHSAGLPCSASWPPAPPGKRSG